MKKNPSFETNDHDDPPVRRSIDLKSMFNSEKVIFYIYRKYSYITLLSFIKMLITIYFIYVSKIYLLIAQTRFIHIQNVA